MDNKKFHYSRKLNRLHQPSTRSFQPWSTARVTRRRRKNSQLRCAVLSALLIESIVEKTRNRNQNPSAEESYKKLNAIKYYMHQFKCRFVSSAGAKVPISQKPIIKRNNKTAIKSNISLNIKTFKEIFFGFRFPREDAFYNFFNLSPCRGKRNKTHIKWKLFSITHLPIAHKYRQRVVKYRSRS